MTSQISDGRPDHLGQPQENKQSAIEKPVDSGSLTLWSKKDFLDWAQLLACRLVNWHLDDSGPNWAPNGIDFPQEIERPFRYRVMLGEHDSKKTFVPPIRVISTAPNASSDNDLAEYAVTRFPDGCSQDETVWLFRDYYEHLVQLGDSEAEELLRLKVKQLLDSPMYRRAHSDAAGDYIAGHPVDHSLLDELIEAAKHCFDNTSPGRKCGTCGKPMRKRDYDRNECNDCRSPKGKLSDLYIAIHASGDSPDRIPEWPTIRAFLRDAFGPDRTNEQLWELMTDRLRVDGWDEERWLRTRYDQFIELLKAGLMNDRSSSGDDDGEISKLGTKPLADLKIDRAKNRKESVDKSVRTPLKPYMWKDFLVEDEWIYENIHAHSLEDLVVKHDQQCQSKNHFKKILTRKAYWNRADRYAKYHGFTKRRFKGACECHDCQTVTDTPLTGD